VERRKLQNEVPKSINHKGHKSPPLSWERGTEGGEALILFRYECLFRNRWSHISYIVFKRGQF
jgi:hypothetical protein